MKIRNKHYTSAIIMASIFSSAQVVAGEAWYVSTALSVMPANYADSDQRNSLLSSSLLLNADYLDTFNFAFFVNNTKIDFKPVFGVDNDINQNAYAGRLSYRLYSDTLGGALTTQLVMHSISNDDVTTETDEVTVVAPKLAYLNSDKDFYIDIEYVDSSYPNKNNLTISQWSPSIGFGVNHNADWLSLKAYFIESSDINFSQGETSFSSFDIKWMHWNAPDAIFGIDSFNLAVLMGERIFAVDNDAFSVYNLADVQQGSFNSGVTWNLSRGFDLTAILGVEKYENIPITNVYNQQYIYISITKNW